MRLLIVDDEAARVFRRGLQEEGFAIDVAHSGETGGELARRSRYDAILLDSLLPGKDGLCITSCARGDADPDVARLPVRGGGRSCPCYPARHLDLGLAPSTGTLARANCRYVL